MWKAGLSEEPNLNCPKNLFSSQICFRQDLLVFLWVKPSLSAGWVDSAGLCPSCSSLIYGVDTSGACTLKTCPSREKLDVTTENHRELWFEPAGLQQPLLQQAGQLPQDQLALSYLHRLREWLRAPAWTMHLSRWPDQLDEPTLTLIIH